MNKLSQIHFQDKVALVRVDYNVPFTADGAIADTMRIDISIPTLQHILQKGGILVLMTHLGRPDGKVVEELSVERLIPYLEEKLQKEVLYVEQFDEELLEAAIESSRTEGTVVLFENIRFFPQEENNDEAFAKWFARFCDVYVNEAFSASHRAHSSIVGIPKWTRERCVGLHFEKEVQAAKDFMKKGKHPRTLILGGAKMDTKAGIISRLIGNYDNFLLGGALANTFLAAQGFEVGDSLVERNQIHLAQETMLTIEAHKEKVVLPKDVIVVDNMDENSPRLDIPVEDVEEGMKIMDIGRKTVGDFAQIIQKSGTVLWNGPLGYTELEKFTGGTKLVAEVLIQSGVPTLVGGGDTITALKKMGINVEKFTYVSTSGGAMMEFIEKDGHLPGIDVLK